MPISTPDFLYPFYVFDTLISRVIVMRTKSFSFIVMQSHAVVQSCVLRNFKIQSTTKIKKGI